MFQALSCFAKIANLLESNSVDESKLAELVCNDSDADTTKVLTCMQDPKRQLEAFASQCQDNDATNLISRIHSVIDDARHNVESTCQPAKLAKLDKSDQPTQSALDQPNQPNQSSDPTEPAEPAEPARPAELAKPDEPAEPAKPAKPAKPAEPAEPAKLALGDFVVLTTDSHSPTSCTTQEAVVIELVWRNAPFRIRTQQALSAGQSNAVPGQHIIQNQRLLQFQIEHTEKLASAKRRKAVAEYVVNKIVDVFANYGLTNCLAGTSSQNKHVCHAE